MMGDRAESTRPVHEVAALEPSQGLTVSERVTSESWSDESALALDRAVRERAAAIIEKAIARARDRVEQGVASDAERIVSQDSSTSESGIVEYAAEIVSEAELTAKQIIAEATARAEAIVDLVRIKASESELDGRAAVGREPRAPGLLAELRKRFGDVEFGEVTVGNAAMTAGKGLASAVHTFPVLASAAEEALGRYSVHVDSGEVLAKTYEHFGRLLIVRGRINDGQYRSLQRLAEEGQLQQVSRELHRMGMRNYSIFDFPVLSWSARHGRDDRYQHEVQFP
jgi:hypothetical protein